MRKAKNKLTYVLLLILLANGPLLSIAMAEGGYGKIKCYTDTTYTVECDILECDIPLGCYTTLSPPGVCDWEERQPICYYKYLVFHNSCGMEGLMCPDLQE